MSRPTSDARREMIRNRALSRELSTNGFFGTVSRHEGKRGPRMKGRPRRSRRVVELHVHSQQGKFTAEFALGRAIRDALDPTRVPSKVRTLTDMSPEEIAAMEAQYGAKASK